MSRLGQWLGRSKRIGAAAGEGAPSADGGARHAAGYQYWRERGCRELEASRPRAAIEALAEAVRLRPDIAEAHLDLGRALERDGHIAAARQAYERALQLDDGYVEAGRALDALSGLPPARADFVVMRVPLADG
jgi:tetratricopeptide (TPR) repeat protein